MLGLFKKVFDGNQRQIGRLEKMADQIDALGPEIASLTDDQLREKTAEFQQRYQNGESLDNLLDEAFAVVREAAKRVLGMYPYKVQLMGGISLHEGNISEMKTGEGKTLTATMPVYLNAITGKGVHVVTVNEYLASRDASEMGRLYEFLGLKVGCRLSNRECLYKCFKDVTMSVPASITLYFVTSGRTFSLVLAVLATWPYRSGFFLPLNN